MKIIFMGTPDFAVPSLERMIGAGYSPIAVVTGQDKERGRGRKVTATPIKELALRNDIPVIQPASVKDPDFADEIAALESDLIVVVAFRILPPDVFNAARLGAFNLHASLLPRFRGAAPIQRALMEGVRETGVTTFFLREKVDTGNVILQREIPVGPDETGGELHDRLAELGADAVVETIGMIESGTAVAVAQDNSAATPAPKIAKEDCRIEWDRSADEVHNQIRALSPYPGAWTKYEDVRHKVFRSRPTETSHEAEPGTVVDASGRLEIACAEGGLEILELQREGKRSVSARDYVNGYEIARGDRLS
jgi:methionyl-tRNA formyltransferase